MYISKACHYSCCRSDQTTPPPSLDCLCHFFVRGGTTTHGVNSAMVNMSGEETSTSTAVHRSEYLKRIKIYLLYIHIDYFDSYATVEGTQEEIIRCMALGSWAPAHRSSSRSVGLDNTTRRFDSRQILPTHGWVCHLTPWPISALSGQGLGINGRPGVPDGA